MDLVGWNKYPVSVRTFKVVYPINGTVVFADRIVKLDPAHASLGEVCLALEVQEANPSV